MNKNTKKGISYNMEVDDIDFGLSYTGYLWPSNESEPDIYSNEKIDANSFGKMPFIIEGNLYASNENISLQIKNIDGKYSIVQFDLNETKKHYEYEEKGQKYIGHDIKLHTEFIMIEAWEESEPDALLAGMKTLRPAWTAFKGFSQSKK